MVVLFSVLIALVVDGWRDDRAERRAVDEALLDVMVEVEANLSELRSFQQVVERRHQRLLAVEGEVDGTRPFDAYVDEFGGYRIPDLDDSAWERLRRLPLAHQVAPDPLREAFTLYSWNDLLEGLDNEVKELVFSPITFDPAQATIAYGITEKIMSEQIRITGAVIPLYEGYLERYGDGG